MGPILSHEALKTENLSERSNIAGFEDEGKEPWAKECEWALEAGEGKEQILP